MSGKKFRKKCMEKNPGGQKFLATRGRGDFVKFYLAPPKMHVAPQMPPQIPRPGAATDFTRIYFSQQAFLVLPVGRPLY